ncbi:MAG: hypothetical protein LBL95_07955 [Deltaproteobacteria bacterium]|jgi:hypothetical protein|nr:hypothetical protein [Deltaproteobacteria bacterium]
MDPSLSNRNRTQLWWIHVSKGAEWSELVKPGFSNAGERDLMIEAGLLTLSKEIPEAADRKRFKAPKPTAASPKGPSPRSKPRPRYRLALTPKGREYLWGHLPEPGSRDTHNIGPILNFVLEALGKVKAGQMELAEALGLGPQDPGAGVPGERQGPDKPHGPGELLGHIKGLGPAQFMAGGGLRLCVLRRSLPGWTNDSIDQVLLGLERDGAIVLYHFDDPSRITAEDKEAALHVAGHSRHYLYLK